jgi:chaperone modulatory protein CbpM
MRNKGIRIELFCEFHNIDIQFVHTIIDFGYIEVIKSDDQVYIPLTSIENLERYVRLANDLGVNLEGLDVINHMRVQIIALRNELEELKRSKKDLLNKLQIDSGEDDTIEIVID